MKNGMSNFKRKFLGCKRPELLAEIIPSVRKSGIRPVKIDRQIQTVIEITVSIEEKTDVGNTAILFIIYILVQIVRESFVLIVFGSVVAGKNDIVVRSQIILIDSQRP